MLHIMMCWLQNILYMCDCERVCVYVRVCVCVNVYVCVVCVCACIKVLELVVEVLKLFRLDAEDAR